MVIFYLCLFSFFCWKSSLLMLSINWSCSYCFSSTTYFLVETGLKSFSPSSGCSLAIFFKFYIGVDYKCAFCSGDLSYSSCEGGSGISSLALALPPLGRLFLLPSPGVFGLACGVKSIYYRSFVDPYGLLTSMSSRSPA